MNEETYTPGHTRNATDFISKRTFSSDGQFFALYLHKGANVLDCSCGPGQLRSVSPWLVSPATPLGLVLVNRKFKSQSETPSIGFGRYIISTTTPFSPDDLIELRAKAPLVVKGLFPDYEDEHERRGWKMFPGIERVYVYEQEMTYGAH